MPTREEAAYHEAGHAVVALALGLDVEYATIRGGSMHDGTQSGGHVKYVKRSAGDVLFNPQVARVSPKPPSRARLLDLATVCAAGGYAAQRLTGEYDHVGVSQDVEHIIEYARRYGCTDGRTVILFAKLCSKRARKLLDDNWREVQDMAARLLRQERVTLLKPAPRPPSTPPSTLYARLRGRL